MDMRWRGRVTQPQSAGNPTDASRLPTPIQRLLPMLLKQCEWATERSQSSASENWPRTITKLTRAPSRGARALLGINQRCDALAGRGPLKVLDEQTRNQKSRHENERKDIGVQTENGRCLMIGVDKQAPV